MTLSGALVQVGVLDGWWEAVGPRGVAAAVLQLLLFTSEPHRELPPYDAPDFPDELARKVERAARILANAKRFSRERDSGVRREVAGPRGMFRVVLHGSTVVGALVDEGGVRASDGAALADDAREALLAAQPPFARTRDM